MGRVERKDEKKAPSPSNDNLQPANDNGRREYHRDYAACRRHGGKPLWRWLSEALDLIAARAPPDDLETQMFVAAGRDVLAEKAEARKKLGKTRKNRR